MLYFVCAELGDEEFFAAELAAYEPRFVKHLEWVEADAQMVSVFIDHKVDAEFLAKRPALRWVVTRSHSTDHIDLAACLARGIEVRSTPAYGDVTMAEHTFALMLALSRRLREVMTLPVDGRFSYEKTRGFDLNGKTLGIIGMGAVGRRVAKLAAGFSMEVLACDLHPNATLPRELHFEYVGLEELLSRAHVISLHASLNAESYHIINAATLARCRKGALLINTARGALVDTLALREALDSGQLGGAGLDVLEDERVMRESAAHIIADEIVKKLRSDASASEARDADRVREMHQLMLGDAILSRSNVVFTPHVAFNSAESIRFLQEKTLVNILDCLQGQ